MRTVRYALPILIILITISSSCRASFELRRELVVRSTRTDVNVMRADRAFCLAYQDYLSHEADRHRNVNLVLSIAGVTLAGVSGISAAASTRLSEEKDKDVTVGIAVATATLAALSEIVRLAFGTENVAAREESSKIQYALQTAADDQIKKECQGLVNGLGVASPNSDEVINVSERIKKFYQLDRGPLE